MSSSAKQQQQQQHTTSHQRQQYHHHEPLGYGYRARHSPGKLTPHATTANTNDIIVHASTYLQPNTFEDHLFSSSSGIAHHQLLIITRQNTTTITMLLIPMTVQNQNLNNKQMSI